MAHELVFDSQGNALMAFNPKYGRTTWHGYGFNTKDLSLKDVKKLCGFDRTIALRKVCDGETGEVLPDVRASFDSEGRYLGTVGSDYSVLQPGDFLDSLAPWVDSGLAEVATAGMLAGGRREWVQLALKDGLVDVTKGDPVQRYLFAAQGHDMSLGLVSGDTATRIVCQNTLTMALGGRSWLKIRHRGDITQGAITLQDALRDMHQKQDKQLKSWKFLAGKTVTAQQVKDFIKEVTKQEGDKIRANSPSARIEHLFLEGKGNKGESWWHLLNAVTEDTTHSLGHKMTGDVAGDREGRALNRMFFGSGQQINALAFNVAMRMASGV